MIPLFEDKPRWHGAPLICLRANLPSFDSPDDAIAFHAKTNPRGFMEAPYPCGFCGKWHYVSKPADPGGSTSGTTRTQKHFDD